MKTKINIFLFILIYGIIGCKLTFGNFYQEIEVNGLNQAIQIYDWQVEDLINKGFNKTKVIDLISFRNMECGREDGLCKGLYGSDIGYFQINPVHKKEYKQSKKLFNEGKSNELWNYQSNYVGNSLWESYDDLFCSIDAITKKFGYHDNDQRFKCFARLYNGSETKEFYGKLALKKRNIIKEYINITFYNKKQD